VSTTAAPTTGFARCKECSTELAPVARACPSCRALVHGAALTEIAAQAQALAAKKDSAGERDAWSRALDLLPTDSQQYEHIAGRVAVLNEEIARADTPLLPKSNVPWYRKPFAAGAALFVLLITKGKFLLLGLTKAKTFISMFAFFGVYWNIFGWPLALGLVLSIYIHEMGHVAELRRLKIAADAPLFIPGIGALVLLRQRVTDPVTDARIGLAGPIYGLAAGVAAYIVALFTHSNIWYAIAQVTGYINLFNLIPIWQLDGARGFHALGRAARWLVVAATVGMFIITHHKMLVVIAAVGAFRAFQKTEVVTHRRSLATFLVLIAALAMLAEIPVNLSK
jgi:Zn-dependent protease